MIVCFCFLCDGYHRDLPVLTHSSPTRRSSDLGGGRGAPVKGRLQWLAPTCPSSLFAPSRGRATFHPVGSLCSGLYRYVTTAARTQTWPAIAVRRRRCPICRHPARSA